MNQKNGAKADGMSDAERENDGGDDREAGPKGSPSAPPQDQQPTQHDDPPGAPPTMQASTPTEPSDADAPDAPETSEVRDTPETPGASEAPAIPDAPATPVPPQASEPGVPETPGALEAPQAARSRDASAAPEAPETGGTPGVPKAPHAGGASDAPERPEAGAAPRAATPSESPRAPEAPEASEALRPGEARPVNGGPAAERRADTRPTHTQAAQAKAEHTQAEHTQAGQPKAAQAKAEHTQAEHTQAGQPKATQTQAGPAPEAARKESDSERTSEFVALKPDLPRPVAPRPATAAPAPSWADRTPAQDVGGSERTREFGAPPSASDDRTMALTRPPAPAAAPASASGAGGAAGPPPLDLLAQLTNTPPKAETPARTAARRVKIWGTLVVLLAIVLMVVQALRPLPAPTLKLTTAASHTADGGALALPWPTEGQAVVDIAGLGRMGSYGEMKPLPIGSVAKVMTTYLILRDHPLKAGDKGPMIPVDQKAQDDYTNGVTEKESVVEVKAGQQISELEALQAVMLPSANNVARLLARWDASTEEAFIKKMNDTAKEFGMTNTTYTDASGLKESTVSTAEDQVGLARRAMAIPAFRQITRLPSYTSTTTSGGNTVETARTQRNFNSLVPLYGVVGIKTGSTTKAGGNLLFAAEKTVGDSKQLIIGAVFGQHKPSIIETATDASKSLILAAGNALRNETVVKKGEVVGRIEDGLGGTVPVMADKDLAVPVWSGASVAIKLTDGGGKLPHSAKAGTTVGTLTVGTGTGEVKVPVSLKDDLSEPSFGAKLTRLG
ncbi:D-alanyl-D-alanine carboxypeptidase [Streptomyces sp. NPDC048416]|uniref:D-alanyl-D-alanine carboxypeptidase n=1 Tax=Streptomyces sp. NPDC048416 TaxID=3365546 RepID=UPI0037170DD6